MFSTDERNKSIPQRDMYINRTQYNIESLTCECATYFSNSTSFFTFVFVVNMDAVKYFKDNSKNDDETRQNPRCIHAINHLTHVFRVI